MYNRTIPIALFAPDEWTESAFDQQKVFTGRRSTSGRMQARVNRRSWQVAVSRGVREHDEKKKNAFMN